MNINDNVFMIIRKGTGFPRERFIPVKIVSIKETTVCVLLPNGDLKSGVFKHNISIKNNNGETNKGK